MRDNEMDEYAVSCAAALFAEHGSFIRAVARFQCKDEAMVEDVYQDFFVTLAEHPIPENVDNIRAYLYRSVTNYIIDAARREAKYRKALNDAGVLSRELKDMAAGSKEAALRLSKEQAEALALRYRDNLSIAATADKMQVDPRTVSQYLSTGLKELRRSAGEADDPESACVSADERLAVSLFSHSHTPSESIAEGVVDLYRALNKCHVLSGGSGLTIDDWRTFLTVAEPVGELA